MAAFCPRLSTWINDKVTIHLTIITVQIMKTSVISKIPIKTMYNNQNLVSLIC